MVRPGTISHARTLADGSSISLDAECVDKIVTGSAPAYFVIRECFDSNSRILVMTQPPPELRMGQTVDVEGVISTLSDGQRAIISPTVYGYTDSEGNLLYHGPLVKGPWQPIAWEWKVDLTVHARAMSAMMENPAPIKEPNTSPAMAATSCSAIAGAKLQSDNTPVALTCKPITSTDTSFFVISEDASSDPLKVYCAKSVTTSQRVLTVTGTMQTENGERVLTVDASGPGYNPQVFVGSLTVASAGTIAWVKTWADGHTFGTGDITGRIVSQNWTDYLYIEEDTRYSGLRVEKTGHGRSKGERVNVVGTLATNAGGERYLAASTVTLNGAGTMNPFGMINKLIGGGDFAYSAGPPVSGQRGVTGGYGLNNIGLLVQTWGKITETDSQWFKIDDGSSVSLTVAYPPFAYAQNDYVALAGISSCEIDGSSNVQRVLRPQPLTCTINQAAGQADPTNTSPVNFTVTFSEPVTGFTSDDVSISGTAGGTKTVTVTQTGTTGKLYNIAITGMTSGTVIATIPSGKALNSSGLWNYASTSTDNTVLFDNAAPSVPTGVAMDHVIPTSRKIRGHWNASTDSGSGLKDYLYQLYYVFNGNQQNLTNWTATTDTFATYDLWYDPSTTDGKTYYVRVKARDNVLNQSSTITSGATMCTTVKIGFLYYKCRSGYANTYEDTRWHIDSYLNNVKYGTDCSGKVTYTRLTTAPAGIYDYDSYDVLFVALPASDFTTAETNALQRYVNQGGNRRIVLIGDTGKVSGYDSYAANNARLNTLASLLDRTTRFHTYEPDKTELDGMISYRDCLVRNHYLTNGVGGLWDASTSAFTTYVHPIAAMRDGENAYPGQFWVVEEDVPQGCSLVFIHDCGMFLFEYDNLLRRPNLVGNYETDYDDVPDRNFKFLENLYTVFP